MEEDFQKLAEKLSRDSKKLAAVESRFKTLFETQQSILEKRDEITKLETELSNKKQELRREEEKADQHLKLIDIDLWPEGREILRASDGYGPNQRPDNSGGGSATLSKRTKAVGFAGRDFNQSVTISNVYKIGSRKRRRRVK